MFFAFYEFFADLCVAARNRRLLERNFPWLTGVSRKDAKIRKYAKWCTKHS